MRVAVCVITFRRCAELRRLLDSVAALHFQKSAPEVSVLIVDNDPKGSARGVADEMAATFPFELIYGIEPTRGISSARNRAVAMAAAADFVAFVDDDETVCPGWLEQLLMEQSSSAADVVMGPVQPLFVLPPPEWIARGGFFVKDYKKFGKIDENYGSTANILIRRSCLDRLNEPFAIKFNLTGGADYHLLLKLKRMGAKISWATKALLTDHVNPCRTNARWILKRRFRVGTTIAMAERLLKPSWPIIRLFKGIFRILQGCILLPVSLLRGKAGMVRTLGIICFGCGILAGFCGYQYQAYGSRKNGHG